MPDDWRDHCKHVLAELERLDKGQLALHAKYEMILRSGIGITVGAILWIVKGYLVK